MTSWRDDVTTSRLTDEERLRILRSVGETNTTIRLIDEELDWLHVVTLELRKSLDARISHNDVMRIAIDQIRDLYATNKVDNPLVSMLRRLKK